MNHQQIWQAIDKAAQDNGFSVSALARKSGLDPTTFNRSKRTTSYGKERWPSTESLNKILNCLGLSLHAFVNEYMNDGNEFSGQLIPLIKFDDDEINQLMGEQGSIKETVDNEIAFPNYNKNLYALEVPDDLMYPVYRKGDRLIVCPKCPIRRGDRVVMKTSKGTFAYELMNQSATKIECKVIGSQEIKVWNISDVIWMVRIFWAEYSL